jgi:hypothetical protein
MVSRLRLSYKFREPVTVRWYRRRSEPAYSGCATCATAYVDATSTRNAASHSRFSYRGSPDLLLPLLDLET